MNKKVKEQFKNIKDIYLLQCICTEQKQEIERLNARLELYKDNCKHLNNLLEQKDNIINELEKYIKECIEEMTKRKAMMSMIDIRKDDLAKLQELKGSDSNDR